MSRSRVVTATSSLVLAIFAGCRTPTIDSEKSRLNNGHVELRATVDPGSYEIVSVVIAFRQSTFGPPNPPYFDSNSQLIQPMTAAADTLDGLTLVGFLPDAGPNEHTAFFYQWVARYKLPNGSDIAELWGNLHVTASTWISARPNNGASEFWSDTRVTN